MSAQTILSKKCKDCGKPLSSCQYKGKHPTQQLTGKDNNHDWVDLGLPSGLKWATCNLGADKPEDYGDYYAWGETKTKKYYAEETYTFHWGESFVEFFSAYGRTIRPVSN